MEEDIAMLILVMAVILNIDSDGGIHSKNGKIGGVYFSYPKKMAEKVRKL